MSFPNQSFWIPSASKRSHQWLLDGSEAELLPSKKHAPEVPTSNLFPGVINSNVPAWGNSFCFQSSPGQFTERLFDTETSRSADKNVDTVNTDHSFGLSMSHTLGKEEENMIADSFEREDGVFISMGQSYSKDDENISLASYSDNNSFALDNVVQDSCSKGESTLVSFGGSSDDNSGRILSSYEFLMSQSTPQLSETRANKDLVGCRSNDVTFSNTTDVSVKKEETKVTKKLQSNRFPSNVRSLLSTGMLDGVPVKYIAWSREKELHGVIKGSGYQCGCNSCDSSKVVNAYEFERHAGCKTKHPNNHIYFENGKTIYGIVQELRTTPQDLLFNVIPTMTGSTINQKSFRLWKESYLAATRELQRIYGKEEGYVL